MQKLKKKIQAKYQRIRGCEKRKRQYIQNNMFKEDKVILQYLEAKTIDIKYHTHMEEIELYWKSLWKKAE
jgi:hypothetical protein